MLELICDKFEDVCLTSGNNIKLCFLDPPDNEKRKYENYIDNLKTHEYVKLLEIWLNKACKITNGPVFFSCAEKWIGAIERIIWENQVQLIQRLWWRYNFGQDNRKRYSPCTRPIYWLNSPVIYPEAIKIPSDRQIKYKDKRAVKGGKMPPNIWDFSRICGTFKEKRKWHVTQHPEALVERIVAGHSLEGDCVLDGFIGSGTTAYVCQKLKRNCIGVDMSRFYLSKIEEEYRRRETNDQSTNI
jgi:site-specific DNA-methyltransferase (adenine-specific)